MMKDSREPWEDQARDPHESEGDEGQTAENKEKPIRDASQEHVEDG
jgi:hypothetical protein